MFEIIVNSNPRLAIKVIEIDENYVPEFPVLEGVQRFEVGTDVQFPTDQVDIELFGMSKKVAVEHAAMLTGMGINTYMRPRFLKVALGANAAVPSEEIPNKEIDAWKSISKFVTAVVNSKETK